MIASGKPILLEAESLCKRFGNVIANDGISLSVRAGEVHALVGENGAGKSTLVGMLFGLLTRDGGIIRCMGREVRWRRPGQALAAGVGLVQQHVTLVADLTVAENVYLGCEPRSHFSLDRDAMREGVSALARKHGLDLDPNARIDRLSVGEQQQVEIAKVLARGIRVLMLDEPTAVLAPGEIAGLLARIRALAAAGLGVVFITHKLPEVAELAGRVTVLRQGRVAWTGMMAETDTAALAKHTIGEEIESVARFPNLSASEPCLQVEDLQADDDRGRAFGPVNLEARRGEILGVAGVAGNGQELLFEILLGHRHARRGRILLGGAAIQTLSPAERVELGVGSVSQDRHERALIPGAALSDHLLVRRGGSHAGACGWLDRKGLVSEAQAAIDRYRIDAPSPETQLESLSGGHQQRSILAFELSRKLELLVLHDPTRGLDLRAAQDIRQCLWNSASEGLSILWISSDLSELMALSSRVVVFYQGKIAGEVPGDPGEIETVGRMMTGTM